MKYFLSILYRLINWFFINPNTLILISNELSTYHVIISMKLWILLSWVCSLLFLWVFWLVKRGNFFSFWLITWWEETQCYLYHQKLIFNSCFVISFRKLLWNMMMMMMNMISMIRKGKVSGFHNDFQWFIQYIWLTLS